MDLGVGRVGGPGVVSERVEARSIDFYNITFEGGELAQVLVDGDGDTDLDLYVFDSEGNLVASDTDLTDVCLGSWLPGQDRDVPGRDPQPGLGLQRLRR